MRRFRRRRAASAEEAGDAPSTQRREQAAGTPSHRDSAATAPTSRPAKTGGESATGDASPSSGDSATGAQSATALPDPAPISPQALEGIEMPAILFNNFDRRFLDLRELAASGLVLYVYPGCERSPADGAGSLAGDDIQHRTYGVLRKRFAETMPGGALVALSSISPTLQFHQSPELAWDQDEDAPFQHYLVSDETLQLAEELRLPTFEHEGEIYYERLTLVARAGLVQRVFHPVVPGQDARQALTWMQLH